MMKKLYFLLAFLLGVVVSATFFIFFGKGNIDVLSKRVDSYVEAKEPIILLDEDGKEFILPSGVSLKFLKQYRESGVLSLEIISTELSKFETVPEGIQYFEKEKE